MGATAPYNFVPASEKVVFPSWADLVSHDVPFRDGLCGRLDLEITAHTPLFIRGEDGEGAFFSTPDGPALPGTSLRGMLRNVVQIASFGKLGPVNDRRLSVRDLHDRGYTQSMTRGGFPLVSAGWLSASATDSYDAAGEDGSPRWTITPCDFARIEYALLKAHFPGFDPGEKRGAAAKYQDRALRGKTLDASCQVEIKAQEGQRHGNSTRAVGSYGLVSAIGPGSLGRLVFTGQPQRYLTGEREKKHHDFFFYGAHPAIPVSFERRRDFSFIHSNGGEQHRLDSDPNEEWKYWLTRLSAGERVPVFFLLDATGVLQAMGLAMMFRLAAETTTGDAVRNAQRASSENARDLAELIFGQVRRHAGSTSALRGRISIEAARATSEVETMPEVRGVLGAPRATYYPSYLRIALGPTGQSSYGTYRQAEAAARGWKRYPSRPTTVDLPPIPTNQQGVQNERVGTSFRPLRGGARFRTRLTFHNLRRVELGALLWALDFGGRPNCRHGLGLGKPFGYGAITLSLQSQELIPNDPTFPSSTPPTPSELRAEYHAFMEREVRGWEASEQIYQLVTMARPAEGPQSDKLRQMQLPEFRQTKSSATNALLPYGSPQGLAAHRAEISSAPKPPTHLPPKSASGSDGAESPSEVDMKIAVIGRLGGKFAGQANLHLDWFASLQDPSERAKAAAALVRAATLKKVKQKVAAGSKPWAEVLEEYERGS